MMDKPTLPFRLAGPEWLYEDELPVGYPYDEMWEHSIVDGVRLFPADPDKYRNPFEPYETQQQQDARVAQMIRDNVDRRQAQQKK